jgi:hypothetical protein
MKVLRGLIPCAFLAIIGASFTMASGNATKVVTFSSRSMKATTVVSGSCWTSSIASRRADAFRCMVGNTIYDPCFAAGGRAYCPQSVVTNTGVVIKLTKKLPAPNPGGQPNAFMMQLAGGMKCNIGTGTIVPGYPYYCSGNLVCSAPVKMGNTYQVNCGTSSSGLKVGQLRKLAVAILWM